MTALYDTIGINYRIRRGTDPRIARLLHAEIAGAARIVNIAAGSGSYEPPDIPLVAVEPSMEMITQRSPDAHPVEQAFAESLPFPDNSFSHAMAVLSMHHWSDRPKAFHEINRVATDKFVALTWDPAAGSFWLVRDYFPQFHASDAHNFPSLAELSQYFDEVTMTPVLVPEDCVDGFQAAYWKRPEAYLDPAVRQSISTFARHPDHTEGLARLATDLATGEWVRRNRSLLTRDSLDAGYRLVVAKTRNSSLR
jgi:SAM-dependent methyltransferase